MSKPLLPLSDPVLTDLLNRVNRPGRYIGEELNTVIKPLSPRPEVLFALVYPDLYEMGMANLSLRILYEILNRLPHVAAERSFLPDTDMQKLLLQSRTPVFSLENRLPIRAFDFLGFTIQTELTATNILQFLRLARMHPLRVRRKPSDPIVIGGGPVLANPEPYADFFDLFVIGDAEEVLPEMLERFRSVAGNKRKFLSSLDGIDGIYIPSRKKPDRVRSAAVRDLDAVPFPVRQVVPLISIPQNRASVEISRGCLNNCRFCQAGYFYRPLRERSPETITKLVTEIIAATGHTSISLLSLSVSNYSCLDPLMRTLTAAVEGRGVTLSLPSLRIDAFGLGILEHYARTKRTGLTFALESLSPAVRRLLNKDLDMNSFREILRTVIEKKWKSVKIYLMYGFPVPDETEENIRGICELADFVRSVSPRAGLTFHLMPFIPKPHTPFQWMQQERPEILKQKLERMKRGVPRKNITIKWHDVDMAVLEAYLTRSGREAGRLIYKAWKAGALMDAWDDRFNRTLWDRLIKKQKRPPALQPGDPLPWDHVDFGFDRDWMRREYERALAGLASPSCRDPANCSACGVCGEGRKNITHDRPEPTSSPPPGTGPAEATVKDSPKKPDSPYHHLEIHFGKRGLTRYLSHLDIVGLFEKAFNGSGIQVRTSFGFSPHRRMIFGPPLALGVESEDETLFTELWKKEDPEDILKKLNAFLPEGLKVFRAAYVEHRKTAAKPQEYDYTVGFLSGRAVRKLVRLKLCESGKGRIIVTKLPEGKNIFKELEKAGIGREEIISAVKKPAAD